MTKTVVFALTNHDQLGDTGRNTGAYAPEFAHPAEVFERAGFQVRFASVDGAPVPLDGLKEDDRVTQSFLQRADVKRVLQDPPTADQLDATDYDVIYFAGGHGTMWDFRDCSPSPDWRLTSTIAVGSCPECATARRDSSTFV